MATKFFFLNNFNIGLFTWFPCEFLGQPHGTSSLTTIKSSAWKRVYVGRFTGRMHGSSHFGSGLFAHQAMFHEERRCPLCFPLLRFHQALINSGIPKFTSCEIPKAWSFLAVIQKVNKNSFMKFYWENMEGMCIESQHTLISSLK